MNKILISIGLIMFTLSLTSTFLWAAFNYTWWVADNSNFGGRLVVLVIMHIIGIYGGSTMIIFGITK